MLDESITWAPREGVLPLTIGFDAVFGPEEPARDSAPPRDVTSR